MSKETASIRSNFVKSLNSFSNKHKDIIVELLNRPVNTLTGVNEYLKELNEKPISVNKEMVFE